MSLLEREPVRRVNAALSAAGAVGAVQEVSQTAHTAADAARALGVDQGAIVKTLIFTIDRRFVMALIAGDRNCREDQLSRALFMKGPVARPDAKYVRAITGFSIGGVAPAGLLHPLPTVIDSSLKRFDAVYAAAGHPHCIFPTTVSELKRLTGGIISYAVSAPSA